MSDLLSELPSDGRLLFVQFGDYLEAAQRFAEGGKENYAAQRYTVDFVAELAQRLERVTVLTFSTSYPLRRLPSGVHCEGVQLYREGQRNQQLALIRAAAREKPTHIVVVAPLIPLLYWAGLTGKRVLPLFADSFHLSGVRERLKARVLAWGLNRKEIEWVSNHNLAASRDLYRIGVDPRKILPFDWPADVVPQDFSAKPAPSGSPLRLIYVGSMMKTKGVGDAIRAVSLLRSRDRDVELSLVGGESEEFQKLVDELGLGSAVHFLGRQPHDRVLSLLNEHDASLVPSWHEYPEGLPMTIYEGLCSRSPVIVSDHPMFGIRMKDGKNCIVFEAASPDALAGAVTRLMDEPGLYERLSKSAEAATEEYLCPLKWDRLIATWLSTNPETRASLRQFALTDGPYGDIGIR